MQGLRILVVGGGIGGLAAAAALMREGHQVCLLERAQSWRPMGAGIIMAGNAAKALGRIGIDPAQFGAPLHRMAVTDRTGKVLSGGDLSALEARYGVAHAVHRQGLHHALLHAAAGVDVRLSMFLRDIARQNDGIWTEFSDGQQSVWDLVIGADGLNSEARKMFLGDAAPAVQYAGYTCWRAVVSAPQLQQCVEMWGPGRRVGLVPLPKGQAYVFLVQNMPPKMPSPPCLEVVAQFSDFSGPAPEVLSKITPEVLLHHDIDELSDVCWGGPQTWLLGDAAHGMTPNFGQGAAQALEDAVTIAAVLRTAPDLPSAFEAYVKARDARVRRIWQGARQFGVMAQLDSAMLGWVRNLLLSWSPDSLTERSMRDILGWEG